MNLEKTPRTWFRYAHGYVNVNAQHLYLTNSGNWSETRNLKEKGIEPARWGRRLRIWLYLFTCLVLMGWFVVLDLEDGKIRPIAMVLALGSMYALYTYLNRETGARFALPLAKLISIEIIDDRVWLHFTNGRGAEAHHELQAVEDKGLEVFQFLQAGLSPQGHKKAGPSEEEPA